MGLNGRECDPGKLVSESLQKLSKGPPMKQSFRLSVALIASFLLVLCYAEDESRYVFSNWGMPAAGWGSKYSFEFVYSDKALSMRVGSEAGWVNYCDEEVEFLCLEGHEFYLAIPRTDIEVDDTWEWSGRAYEATAKFDMSVFGVSIQVIQIDAPPGDGPNIFYFSRNAGLVGFGYSPSPSQRINTTQFYILESFPGLSLERPFD